MARVDPPTGTRHPVRPWIGHVGATLAVMLAGTLGAPGNELIWTPATSVVDVVAVLILYARHRAPQPVAAVIAAMVVLALVFGVFNPGLAVATAIAVYTVTVHTGRSRGLAVTVADAVLMTVAAVAGGSSGFQDVLVVLLGGAVGEAIRTQREYVASITERAERAERTREALARQRVAETRLTIARDLHDVVAHQISVINLHAGVAASAVRERPADAEQSLTTIRRAARTVLTEIGDLLATLRDPSTALGPPGLSQLDDIVREFAGHGLVVTVRFDGNPYPLQATTDVTAMRVIQEALTNAHKHGTGGDAHVLIEYLPRSLRLTITNLVASPTAATGVGTGHGLTGMSERVESVRGTLTYGADGVGRWSVVTELPTDPEDPTITEERV